MGSGGLETWGINPRTLELILNSATSEFQLAPSNLNLAHNQIGSLGVSVILRCPFSSALQTLILTANGIHPRGAGAIAQLLRTGRLEFLDLDYNRIGNEGGTAIGTALPHSRCLRHLSLCCNNIGNEGAISICAGLKFSESLEHIGIAHNYLSENTVRSAADASIECLERFKKLQSVQISAKRLQSTRSTLGFAGKLKMNTIIGTQSITGLELGDLDVQFVGQALKHCPALLCLDLSNNALGDIGIIHICGFLEVSSSIQILKTST